MMELTYVKVFLDWTEATRKLKDPEKGRLIDALVAYARGDEGVEDQLSGNEAYVFPMFQLQIDRDRAELAAKSEAMRENGKKGGRPRKAEAFPEKPKKPKKQKVFSESQKSEEEDKDKDKEEGLEEANASSCAEPFSDASAPPAGAAAAITLPLNTGEEFPVSMEQCQEWAGLYPAVDVIQQLRNMRGWLCANPSRRKTRRGILGFVNSWLKREQDRPGTRTGAAGASGDRPDDGRGNSAAYPSFLDLYMREEEFHDPG